MLERNGIQCWLTTSENIALPEVLTSTGDSDVVTSTVKLQNRKNYIIHWKSISPLTAWCEVHTKNVHGKITKSAAKCEMNSADPKTQQRSSRAGTPAGRNLGFYGPKNTSSNLGMAWLEIRRAISIKVLEVTKSERQMTIDWVPTDHPEVGTPYATFVFNFELLNPSPEMNAPSSPSNRSDLLSSLPSTIPIMPFPQRSLTGSHSVSPSNDSRNTDGGDLPSSLPIKPSLKKSSASSDSVSASNHSRNTNESDLPSSLPSTSPMKPSPQNFSEGPNSVSASNYSRNTGTVVLLKSQSGHSSDSDSEDDVSPSSSSILLYPHPTSGKKTFVENSKSLAPGDYVIPRSNVQHTEYHSKLSPSKNPLTQFHTPSAGQNRVKRPHSNSCSGPSTLSRDGDVHTESDSESADQAPYTLKNARIQTQIDAHVEKLAMLNEKEKFMQSKQAWAQLTADIRAAELDCGPLSPDRSFVQDRIPSHDADDDDDFPSKRRRLEADLTALRTHLSELKEKKAYLGRKLIISLKARLKQLKADIQKMEQRCEDLSSTVSRIVASVAASQNSST